MSAGNNITIAAMITPEPAPLDTCEPYQKLSLEIFSVVMATTLCVILEEILDASFDVPVAFSCSSLRHYCSTLIIHKIRTSGASKNLMPQQ